MAHEDYAWLKAEIQRLREVGKSGAPLPCIVRSSENAVLRIIHLSFFEQHWDVMAKVFDGLIAEPNPELRARACSIQTAMEHAERRCMDQGWYVKLAEKPLH